MERDNVLDINQVMDEAQNLRRRIYPQNDSDWIPHGEYIVLRENTQILLKITYRHGVIHGRYVDFWSNGKVASEGQFRDGNQEDTWHFYNEDGTIREIVYYNHDKEIVESESGNGK